MSRIVLRLLLCLSLVLNGTGYVMAATQMQLAHGALAAPAVMTPTASPCHDEGASNLGPGPHGAMSHAAAGTDDIPPPAAHGDEPGCCQSSLCTCDCLQHATAAITSVATPAAVRPGRYTASPRETRPPAPVLHALLRPPII